MKKLYRFGGLPWVECMMRVAHDCFLCGGRTRKGSWGFRPLRETRKFPRYVRVCPKCKDRMEIFG